MKRTLIFFGYILIVVLIIFLYFHFNLEPKAEKSTSLPNGFSSTSSPVFVIEKNEGVKEIAEKLLEKGIIKNKIIFEIYTFLKNVRTKFWPGEYELKPGMKLSQIINLLTSQPSKEEETITIPEGWTNKEIINYLKEKGLTTEEEFLTAQKKIEQEKTYDFLADKPVEANLSGYLFPDTYRVYKKTSAEEIIKKMLDNFGQKLDAELRNKISAQGGSAVGGKEQKKSIFETINLASLVEKEAANEIDRRIIAGIFLKRLTTGKRLESCATINYILGENKKKLSYQDTRTPSSYNTYLNAGLPPGPICNPGLVAIKAVIYPLETDYFYFLSPGDGRTIFSKTYEEHLKNKEIYLK